ncbi:MAG: alkaline phosphatase [Pseudomonadales bacterium]
MINRRNIIRTTPAAILGVSSLSACSTTPDDQAGTFAHGVASGDPLADRVILWTRITTQAQAPVSVRWWIAEDEAFRTVVNEGEAMATPGNDFTVKVDALGLDSDRFYFYRFATAAQESPVGRTRTLPVGNSPEVKLAVSSCANYPFGYFNVYRRIAERNDLNAVIHLGDYLYEYAPGTYDGGSGAGRTHFPEREIVTLADYRMRHAQYKRDLDLQAAHQQHPWICVWDDHESTNNSWAGGAENHNPGEGDWQTRKQVAIQAYHEWLPIREQRNAASELHIYRSFKFGDTADLIMLDTRLHGRTEQIADNKDQRAMRDPAHTLLGADQAQWLAGQLRASNDRGAAWRVLGQQCMFGQLEDDERNILNTDQWDGYPNDRDAVLDQLESEQIDNTVILTGDIHSAWGLDITRDPFSSHYDPATGRGSLAVELVCTSVTSPGPFGDTTQALEREQMVLRDRPHIHWVNFRERGYLLLDMNGQRAAAEWWMVDTIASPNHKERLAARMVTESGTNHLRAES